MSLTTTFTPQQAPTVTTATAARAVGVTKLYGAGDATVAALDDVSVGPGPRPLHRHHGSVGLRQVDPAAHARRPRPPDVGRGVPRRHRDHLARDKALTLLRRDRIGFIFQSFNLLPTMTAAENIVLPMRIAGRKPDADWVASIVETVGLGGRLEHRPAQLSGGQQQRVAAARALASRPEIVFADEPTGALDSRSGAELLGFLRTAVDELGQTVVMVTHDPNAAAYADRVLFLADGHIVDEMHAPTAEDVLDYMKHLGA